MNYQPNERIVDRAVHLWVQMLGDPKYDNLGPNSLEPPDSFIANKMAAAISSQLPRNNTPEVLARFGAELKKLLMGPTKWKSDYGGEYEQTIDYLGVDYQPDRALALAAERAGLVMKFPWKTTMHLRGDTLSVSCGYGAAHVYHYPLTNDRWLVTTLYGDDMPKIIALVEGGVLGCDLAALAEEQV